MKTIIMAGGRGTRIAELFPNIPKPLIPVDGMPILEREIRSLAQQGFKDIILTVGYLADKIISYFGDGSKLGVKIDYFVEETPLGNADALFRLRDKIGVEPFLLLNADVTNQPVIAREEVSWDELNEKHRKMQTLLGRDGAYLDGIYLVHTILTRASRVSVQNTRLPAIVASPNQDSC